MLIEFAITNFRSIKERQIFSMLPSDRVKERKIPLLRKENYKLDILPIAVIYGLNNAGKSNIIKAFHALEWLVLSSHKFSIGDKILANEHFEFDEQTLLANSIFELDFIANDKIRYLYIVEFNKQKIIREELFSYAISVTGKTTKRKWYIRNAGNPIQYGDEFKGIKKPIEDRLIENMLFLSKAVNENNTQLRPIFEFFQQSIHITNMSDGYVDFQTRYFGKIAVEKDGSKKMETLNTVVRNIDTGILYLEVEKISTFSKQIKIENKEDEELTENEKVEREKLLDILKQEIKAYHRLFNGKVEKGVTSIPLSEESEGTRKFIAVFTKFMELQESYSVIIVDELEKSLHPLLTQTLIRIITNPETNPNQAQLIFTTHDTNLFDVIDNDEINILQKDIYGATEIYTLSDIKGLRNDIPAQKWYLSGKLGGIPNIGSFQINKAIRELNEEK